MCNFFFAAPMKNPTILIADDHRDFRESLVEMLARTGKYDTLEAENGAEALRLIEANPQIDCILLDYFMPELNGLEVVERLRTLAPQIPVVMISSYAGKPPGWVEEKAGQADVIYAGKSAEQILRAVDKNVHIAPEIEIDDYLRRRLQDEGFVFESAAMKKVVHQAIMASNSQLSVLLTGETGVGKTQLARLIHVLSDNNGLEPFIAFACSNYAANQQLFSSQVFGHTRSAFTNANVDKKSLFEEAGGGTLFLDEISEIPLEAQATLLAALDQRTYQRLGENKVRPIHCRIISATNRELEREAQESLFRLDLLQRLKQEVILIPPLRERTEDVPVLVRLYLREYAQSEKGRILRIEPEAVAYLKRQDWPGNTRQLRAILTRAAHATQSQSISVADLYPMMRDAAPLKAPPPAPPVTQAASSPAKAELRQPMIEEHSSEGRLEAILDRSVNDLFEHDHAGNLKEVLEQFRKRLIIESLRRSRGNVKDAERRFWGYAETGKGGLMHQIRKFGINYRQFRD